MKRILIGILVVSLIGSVVPGTVAADNNAFAPSQSIGDGDQIVVERVTLMNDGEYNGTVVVTDSNGVVVGYTNITEANDIGVVVEIENKTRIGNTTAGYTPHLLDEVTGSYVEVNEKLSNPSNTLDTGQEFFILNSNLELANNPIEGDINTVQVAEAQPGMTDANYVIGLYDKEYNSYKDAEAIGSSELLNGRQEDFTINTTTDLNTTENYIAVMHLWDNDTTTSDEAFHKYDADNNEFGFVSDSTQATGSSSGELFGGALSGNSILIIGGVITIVGAILVVGLSN